VRYEHDSADLCTSWTLANKGGTEEEVQGDLSRQLAAYEALVRAAVCELFSL
jgi:hypothetical protein